MKKALETNKNQKDRGCLGFVSQMNTEQIPTCDVLFFHSEQPAFSQCSKTSTLLSHPRKGQIHPLMCKEVP